MIATKTTVTEKTCRCGSNLLRETEPSVHGRRSRLVCSNCGKSTKWVLCCRFGEEQEELYYLWDKAQSEKGN